MSTETKNKVETVPVVSAEVVKAIIATINADATAESARFALSKVVVSEAKRCGYDRDQAQLMTKLSYRKVQLGKLEKATAEAIVADKEKLRDFDRKYASRVSTIMAMAYPENSAASVELEKAAKLNAKAGTKGERIGENTMIKIARGKLTTEEALAGKVVPRNTPAPSKLPRATQIGNAVAGLFARFEVDTIEKLDEYVKASAAAVKIKRDALKAAK